MMRLSARSASLLCLASLTLPLGVSAAAAKLTLTDIIAIVQTNKKPLSFTFDATGTLAEEGSATVHVEGVQNGNMKSLARAAADLTIDINIAVGKESIAGKVHVILVDSTLYARLSDVLLTGSLASNMDDVKPYLNTWFRIPVDPAEYAQYLTNQQSGRRTTMKQLNAYVQIMTTTLENGTMRYHITIPRNKQRRLFTKIFGNTYSSSSLRSQAINLQVTIDTLHNVFSALTGEAMIAATVDGKKASISLSSTTTTLKTTPSILAPAKSTPLEDFQEPLALSDARNAQRRSDINTILNATYQYAIDNNGTLPVSPKKDVAVPICSAGKTCNGVSLDILNELYIVRVPTDPLQTPENDESGYTFRINTAGSVTIAAPLAEDGVTISVTR